MERDCFYNELKYVRDYACKAAGLDPEIAGWKTAVDAMTKQLADAQATVEALQRERSKKQAEEAMVVFAQLSQLQALVRPFAELAKHLDGREFNTLHAILRNGTWIKVTMDDFMALKAATLDATTPAGGQG